MVQAQRGDTVQVHYTGKLEFTIGEGQIIPGFEQAVVGMNPGESKTVTIPMDQAYGPHREEMVLEVDRKQFPEHLNPEIGQQLQVRQQNGQTMIVTVVEVSDTNVTLDANHPLAGENLTFDIHLVGIV